jgi:hypothetical protein
VTGQYGGSTYPEGFRWVWHFREQRSAFATVGSPCLHQNFSAAHQHRLSICLNNAPWTDALPKWVYTASRFRDGSFVRCRRPANWLFLSRAAFRKIAPPDSYCLGEMNADGASSQLPRSHNCLTVAVLRPPFGQTGIGLFLQ